MVEGLVEKPYRLETRDRWLLATFAEPWAVFSWAIVNGGWQRVTQVVWLYLQPNEIAGVMDPLEWMQAQMHAEGLAGAAGFMTSRRAHSWAEGTGSDGVTSAWAVGTVGMSNALRAGDPTGSLRMPGTINMLVCCSTPVTVEGATELLCLASEAKALATMESGLKSVQSGLPATGTGTDYLALAWPLTGDRTQYGGKHTAIGSAVGQAIYNAVSQGIVDWRKEWNVPA